MSNFQEFELLWLIVVYCFGGKWSLGTAAGTFFVLNLATSIARLIWRF